MKYLILGAAGFIGSQLAEYLYSKGNEVVGIDNFSHPCGFKSEFVPVEYGDVRYPPDLATLIEKSDMVYHLAAVINVDKSIAHPQETIDINFTGTMNVLDLCKRFNKPMVFASTSEIYGGHEGLINEGSPTYSQSPYAVSKLAADKLCGNYHDLYGLEVYRLRIFNTYGPWQSNDQYGAVIPIFTSQVLAGQQPTIFGGGDQERDFMYIDDTVRAYDFVPKIKLLSGEPVNIGTGQSISINDVAFYIKKTLGRSDLHNNHLDPRPGEVKKLQADTTLIQSHGFVTEVSFEEGLKRYIAWHKEYRK